MIKNNFLRQQNKPEMKTRETRKKNENKVEKFKKQKKIKNCVVVSNNHLIQT